MSVAQFHGNRTATLRGTTLREKVKGVGNRHIFIARESVLKFDGEIPQSQSEAANYYATPARWRKYLAPVVASGEDADGNQWVEQSKVRILRANDWRRGHKGGKRPESIPAAQWCVMHFEQEAVWEEFADALMWAITGWGDSGQRQWTVAGSRLVIHDYAACEERDATYFEVDSGWHKRWAEFMVKWDKREHELDWRARVRKASSSALTPAPACA